MWLFTYNQTCFGYIQITTLNNKNTSGAPYNMVIVVIVLGELNARVGQDGEDRGG